MKIRIKVGGGKVDHAADFDPVTDTFQLYCNSMNYVSFHAYIVDFSPPTLQSVTCKKCLKNQGEWKE